MIRARTKTFKTVVKQADLGGKKNVKHGKSVYFKKTNNLEMTIQDIDNQAKIQIMPRNALPVVRRLTCQAVSPEACPEPDKLVGISVVGRLIVYTVCGFYLLEDFTTGFSYAKTDYSLVDSTLLFKANILRLQALFMHKLSQKYKQYLTMAKDTVKEALQLFTSCQSHHGIGVSNFHLALLHSEKPL